MNKVKTKPWKFKQLAGDNIKHLTGDNTAHNIGIFKSGKTEQSAVKNSSILFGQDLQVSVAD